MHKIHRTLAIATRQTNWYLREYVGCNTTTDGENWAFTSGLTNGKGGWKAGFIYIPPPGGPRTLPIRQITQSIASMSWTSPPPAEKMTRSLLLAQRGYMFVNFLEASIEAVQTNRGLTGSSLGLSSESGLYSGARDDTYQRFQVLRSQEDLTDSIKFTQTAGVLDESVLKALTKGAPPASWGAFGWFLYKWARAKQKLEQTPPVWTELTLTIYFNGTYDASVTSFSLFPNVSLHHGGAYRPSTSLDGGKTWSHNVPLNPQGKAEDYFKEEVSEGAESEVARKFIRWQTEGWGLGNPWRKERPKGWPTDIWP